MKINYLDSLDNKLKAPSYYNSNVKQTSNNISSLVKTKTSNIYFATNSSLNKNITEFIKNGFSNSIEKDASKGEGNENITAVSCKTYNQLQNN